VLGEYIGEFEHGFTAFGEMYSDSDEVFYVDSGLSFSDAEADWTGFEKVELGPAQYRAKVCDHSFHGVVELDVINEAEKISLELNADVQDEENPNLGDLKATLSRTNGNEETKKDYVVDVEANLENFEQEKLLFLDVILELEASDGSLTDDDPFSVVAFTTSIEVAVEDEQVVVVEDMQLSGIVKDLDDASNIMILLDGVTGNIAIGDVVIVDGVSSSGEEPACVTIEIDEAQGRCDVKIDATCSARRKLLPNLQPGLEDMSQPEHKRNRDLTSVDGKISDHSSTLGLLMLAGKGSLPFNQSLLSVLLFSLILLAFCISTKYLSKNE